MLRDRVGRVVGLVAVSGMIAGGAVIQAASAWADPPNCSVADFAGVTAGVSASMSAYLFAHPDTNAFLSSLDGMSRADAMMAEKQYYDRNPGVEGDLAGIRQPLTDLRARCGEDDVSSVTA